MMINLTTKTLELREVDEDFDDEVIKYAWLLIELYNLITFVPYFFKNLNQFRQY